MVLIYKRSWGMSALRWITKGKYGLFNILRLDYSRSALRNGIALGVVGRRAGTQKAEGQRHTGRGLLTHCHISRSHSSIASSRSASIALQGLLSILLPLRHRREVVAHNHAEDHVEPTRSLPCHIAG